MTNSDLSLIMNDLIKKAKYSKLIISYQSLNKN